MQQLVLDKDILPVSEFRTNTAAFLKQIKETKRPIVLTQHGRSAVVLLDISEYVKLSKANNISKDQNNNSLLELCGKWKDDRTAEEIVEEIYSTRTSSNLKGSL